MFRAGAVAGIAAAVPEVNVLGTYDLNLVEVTPVVVQDELYLFESVRASYWQFSPEAAGGAEYLRFVHMLSGNATPAFGAGHALGCALVEEEEEEDHPRGGGGGGGAPAAAEPGVYAFGTRRAFGATAFPPAAGDDDGSAISVFWSIDGMQTWQNRTAIDFKKEADPRRKKRTVFNTSVGKGKLNGTTAYVLAYEWSNPATPGGWNTNFAVSRDLKGWQLLDDDAFAMPADVEHADPTLRYVEADGYWYCIPARRDPPPGGGWHFFQEIYRSRDLRTWEAAPGMGSPTQVGTPLLLPDAARDTALAPRVWHPDTFDALAAPNGTGQGNWTAWEDCNSSDLDLCEWKGETFMIFNWGCQHETEALALAVSPVALDPFLQGWFAPASAASTPAPAVAY